MQCRRCTLTVLSLLACLLLLYPASAFALMETDEWSGSSAYNPNVGDYELWRWNWGNSLNPDVRFDKFPEDTPEELRSLGYLSARDGNNQTTGFLYEMRQLDELGQGYITPIPGVSQRTGRYVRGEFQGELRTFLEGSFDVGAISDRWGWTWRTGATGYGEGLYGLTFRFQNQFRTESASVDFARRVALGVDRTPPLAVRNLRTNEGLLRQADGWTEARWRDLSWDAPTGLADNYDALSGVGRFAALVDGEEVASVSNTSPQRGFEPYAQVLNTVLDTVVVEPQVSNITIEDLPAGVHTLGIVTIDRATNRSPVSSVVAKIDYDTPQAAFVWPAPDREPWRMRWDDPISVVASDAAGISSVEFFLDGVSIGQGFGSQSGGTWSIRPNLLNYPQGPHVLTAVVKDMIGSKTPNTGSWLVPHVITVGPQPVVFDWKAAGPAGGILYPPNNLVTKKDVRPRVAFDSSATRIIASLNGKPFKLGRTVTAPGSYTLVVTAYDIAGNATRRTVKFRIDRSGPSARISASARGRAITLNVSSLSEDATITVTIDGVKQETKTVKKKKSAKFTHEVPTREATHQTRRVKYVVKMTDHLGNSSTRVGYIYVRYWDIIRIGPDTVRLIIY